MGRVDVRTFETDACGLQEIACGRDHRRQGAVRAYGKADTATGTVLGNPPRDPLDGAAHRRKRGGRWCQPIGCQERVCRYEWDRALDEGLPIMLPQVVWIGDRPFAGGKGSE